MSFILCGLIDKSSSILGSRMSARILKMAEKNIHGLGRYIPQEVRREIRKRCGFGCVLCGLAYYDYEHFDPDFKDAKEHNAQGMTLLCMQCNQKRARGTLSAATVARANENPKCKQQGFASEIFDFGVEPLKIIFAGSTFKNCTHILKIAGFSVLSIAPPEEPGSPMLLTGFFSDSTGATTLKIENNIFIAGDENWDVEIKGPVIKILRGLGDPALILRVQPPHGISVELIDMEFDGCKLKGDTETLNVWDGDRLMSTIRGFSAHNVTVGIDIV